MLPFQTLPSRSTDASPGSTDGDLSHIFYSSNTITCVIAAVTPILVLVYFCILIWAYGYTLRYPRPLNKNSGIKLQQYAPAVYALIVVFSLIQLALSSWMLLQYRFQHNYPNINARTGIILLLFCSCWTTVTAAVYTLLFLHPTWARHPVSSIGAQAIWVLVTWSLWVAGTAVTSRDLPDLLSKGTCSGLVYCSQIRTLFAFSILEIVTLTVGMLTMIWLAWRSAQSMFLSTK